MLSLLRFIPGISRLLQWAGNIGIKLYSAKLAADGAHEAKVVELAARELQLDETEARLNAQAKSEIRHIWYAPENLFGYIGVAYWGKVIFIDYVIISLIHDLTGFDLSFVTLPLKGSTATAMTMIMTFWLGKRGIENVATIL